jgi:hypothetical protein
MPGKHRISAEQPMLFLGSIRERLSIPALTSDEYSDALQAASALGIVGGGIDIVTLAIRGREQCSWREIPVDRRLPCVA